MADPTITYVVRWTTNFSHDNEEEHVDADMALDQMTALRKVLPERHRPSVHAVKRTVTEEPWEP